MRSPVHVLGTSTPRRRRSTAPEPRRGAPRRRRPYRPRSTAGTAADRLRETPRRRRSGSSLHRPAFGYGRAMAQRSPDGHVRDARRLLTGDRSSRRWRWATSRSCITPTSSTSRRISPTSSTPTARPTRWLWRGHCPGRGSRCCSRADQPARRILVVWILFVLAVIPTLVIPQYAPALDRADALELALWVGGCFLLITLLGTRRVLRGFIPCAAAAINFLVRHRHPLVCFNGYVLAAGVKLELPSLGDVYGVRASSRRPAPTPCWVHRSAAVQGAEPSDDRARPLGPAVAVGPGRRPRPGLPLRRAGQQASILSPLVAIAVAFLVFKRRRLPSVGAALLAGPLLSLGSLMADWLTGRTTSARCSCAGCWSRPGW